MHREEEDDDDEEEEEEGKEEEEDKMINKIKKNKNKERKKWMALYLWGCALPGENSSNFKYKIKKIMKYKFLQQKEKCHF